MRFARKLIISHQESILAHHRYFDCTYLENCFNFPRNVVIKMMLYIYKYSSLRVLEKIAECRLTELTAARALGALWIRYWDPCESRIAKPPWATLTAAMVSYLPYLWGKDFKMYFLCDKIHIFTNLFQLFQSILRHIIYYILPHFDGNEWRWQKLDNKERKEMH